MKIKLFFSLIFLLCASQPAWTQSGGTFNIAQSVTGGGGNSFGGNFNATGTIGQPAVGTNAGGGGSFNVRGGFWANGSAPTAADVSISGRVRHGKHGIIRRVRLSLIDLQTGVVRTTQASADGSYRFDELEIGRIYVLRAESKNFVFTPESYVLQPTENLADVDFAGERIF